MKNILIISSSPRQNGNSDTLCDKFAEGAISAGSVVDKLFLKDFAINYCTGCGYCVNNQGKCSQKDDMDIIKDKMLKADVIVIATPIYFYTMCGQLKTFIDRNCFFYTLLENKDFYTIMTAAENSENAMDYTKQEFQGFFDCLNNPHLKGEIVATGVWNKNDAKNSKHLKTAFEMGKSIK